MRMKSTFEIVLIAVNAGLYAGVGYLTFLGIFAPVVGTVRFWPAVVVPAVFAVVYSPRIGALGAGLGIFISDMLIHGDPILSITVGVTSNIAGFYIIGVLARKFAGQHKLSPLPVLLQAVPLAIAVTASWVNIFGDFWTSAIFIAAAALSLGLSIAYSLYRPAYSGLVAASSLGLLVGAAIIGLGVWAYSQYFSLPAVAGGGQGLPLFAAAIWFLWTYLTEIPFLMILLPPLVAAVRKAVPTMVRQ
ncbi:MAG: hypothetical protein NZ581_00200 [Candidatus Caldarchaeum sp.]|nr:hypothetical protein [Candidatus Caldarchaeum sp.]MDW8434609.1 hypothetical protein [Candidatus Caldarchaeum sp.]